MQHPRSRPPQVGAARRNKSGSVPGTLHAINQSINQSIDNQNPAAMPASLLRILEQCIYDLHGPFTPSYSTALRLDTTLGQPCDVCLLIVGEWRALGPSALQSVAIHLPPPIPFHFVALLVCPPPPAAAAANSRSGLRVGLICSFRVSLQPNRPNIVHSRPYSASQTQTPIGSWSPVD